VLAGLETAAFGRGFLEVNGIFSRIDVPGAFSTQANGINDAGQIVGDFPDSNGGTHGLLEVNGIFSTIDVPGASVTSARGINNAGQIVGYVQYVPEPSSLVLFGVGLFGLGLAWRRKFTPLT